MIQGLASIRTQRLALREASIEHQDAIRGRVHRKDSKHPPLVIVLKVKKAIPCQCSIEPPTESQGSHVSDDPLLVRHSSSAKRDQHGRAIHAGDMKTSRRHVMRYRHSTSTAKIQYGRVCWKEAKEALDVGFINPRSGAPIGVPGYGMALVMTYDLVCRVIHRTNCVPRLAKHCAVDWFHVADELPSTTRPFMSR